MISKCSSVLFCFFFLIVSFLSAAAYLNVNQAGAAETGTATIEIESRPVNIWSDGTRLSGDIWKPKKVKPGEKRPALILCHGWGGVRSHLNQSYAPDFARAGYMVLTFDYRGWGESDSRLVMKGKMPVPDDDGEVTVKAQAIRDLVDPFDQTEDIMHCIDFLLGEPGVDPNRIGLWGTSFGGGHVLYVAAHDERVRCIVSQVPAMDGSWAKSFSPQRQAIRRARGEIAPVPQTGSFGKLKGTPYISRIAKYHPVDCAERLKIPMLIIVAEKEELMDNRLHGKKVYDLIKDRLPARYEIFQGTHFEIYEKGRPDAIRKALAWFDRYL